MLGAALVCPLGGKYAVDARNPAIWRSTAWTDGGTVDIKAVPKDYRFEFLDWFGGIELDFALKGQTLSTHVEMVLRPKAGAGDQRTKVANR